MAHSNFAALRAAQNAAPTPVVASWVGRGPAERPALPAAPLPPPLEAFVPPLPPAPRHPRPWPLNETEIDLPFDPPPRSLPPSHYIGTVRGILPCSDRRCAVDVAATPAAIALFGFHFDREQALKLCRLLLDAVQYVQNQEGAA